jgi:CHRD domain-containing protein
MNTGCRHCLSVAGMAAAFIAGYSGSALSEEVRVLLNGNQEVPPVATAASGSGAFMIGADKTVSGSLKTLSIAGTAAHIHEGGINTNGPVVIPLTKTSDSVWSVPTGAKISDAQYESYKAGQLYVNVHSAAHAGGEIRGQLIPK